MISFDVKCTAYGCINGVSSTKIVRTNTAPNKESRFSDSEPKPCIACNGTGYVTKYITVLVSQDINYGDHGESRVTGLANLDPSTTIKELVETLFCSNDFRYTDINSVTIVPAVKYHNQLRETTLDEL